MKVRGRFHNEALMLWRSPAMMAALLLLALVTSLAMLLGKLEIQRQTAAIERFQAMDLADREAMLTTYEDFGGAAYGTFHATWNPPSDAAFLAIGQRDLNPWVLRIRALALEGQIYESDDFNPVLALSGRFDFAFVMAFVLPLFIVLLLYDLVAGEREAGRLPLLLATVAAERRLWINRVAVRMLALLLACLLPLWLGGLLSGLALGKLLGVSVVVILNVLLWSGLILLFAFRPWSSAVIATSLAGVWMLLTLLVPLVGKLAIDRLVPGVDGARISLLQRETVNAAWDLPKAATMEPFYASHPEWAGSAPVTAPFHWKWYYAFQQVGDETAAPLSLAYRQAIAERDRLAGLVAWLSPSVAVIRSLQSIAETDVGDALAYDARIRDYHEQLRKFYYPYLFNEVPYRREVLEELPDFVQVTEEDGMP